MKFIIALVSFFLLTTPTFAQATTAAEAFLEINNCVKKDETKSCRKHLTASSYPLYDRITSYGVIGCFPKDAEYYSEEEKDGGILLRAKLTDSGKPRYMRLFFIEEEGAWKLDVPNSLRIGMGKNWEKQVNMVEQFYLMMKAQMGDKLDCDLIRTMVEMKKPGK